MAGVRHFTFVYEAPTSAPGSIDLENFVTWARISNPVASNEVSWRHELEIGLTDRVQASLYLTDWSYTTEQGQSGTSYSDSAIELIYNLTNPVIDPLGLSIYQEVRAGPQLMEWESKVIAQKNVGPLILVWNGTVEATWQGQGWRQTAGEFQHALGASYEFSPRVSVGLELLDEFVFRDWDRRSMDTNVFFGPNACYRRANWFVTVTGLVQATGTPDEPDFQLRTIFGVEL